ncbi:MAG: hypothetical protein AAF724_18495 [Pseudomonadota bacterium]
MFKNYARRRMNEIDYNIRHLVDNQDHLSRGQEMQLDRLDRAYKFWRRLAA